MFRILSQIGRLVSKIFYWVTCSFCESFPIPSPSPLFAHSHSNFVAAGKLLKSSSLLYTYTHTFVQYMLWITTLFTSEEPLLLLLLLTLGLSLLLLFLGPIPVPSFLVPIIPSFFTLRDSESNWFQKPYKTSPSSPSHSSTSLRFPLLLSPTFPFLPLSLLAGKAGFTFKGHQIIKQKLFFIIRPYHNDLQ